MRETRKLAAILLILAILVSCLHCTAVAAAAKNTTATAKPSGTAKPTPVGTAKPVINTTGTITGTVFDATGNLVPRADVYLHDGRGVAIGLTETDRNGTYNYTELDPGNYSIVVQIDGFAWLKKFTVTRGSKNVTNVFIPDYVHYPVVTPWPTPKPAANNSTPTGGTKVITPAPTPKPTPTNVTVNHTAPEYNETIVVNESAEVEESGGSPIDGIINGIVGFFQSLFGMQGQ